MEAIRSRYILPVGVFAVFVATVAYYLYQIQYEGRVVANIPSVLIDKPVPAFDLPPVLGRERGLSSADLKGEVRLVNFFASWCAACQVEHPILNRLTREGIVPVYGVNYKDKPEDARRWLDRLGDPYVRAGADVPGRVGIEWGVYGLPESFIVGRDGRIAYKHIGPITPRDLEETILPIIEELRK